MESAPMNISAGLERRRALLAKLMAQAGAGGAGARPGTAGFRAGGLGGRTFHNQSDLAAAPFPSINMGFRPASGVIPPGFQNDINAPLINFPGQAQPAWSPGPPPGVGGGPPDAVGGGQGIAQQAQTNPVAPASYQGPIRSFTGYEGPLEAPDPWEVFRRPTGFGFGPVRGI